MPFKSEKQRKWMHANDPKMAKKGEKEEKSKKESKVRSQIKKMVREIMDEKKNKGLWHNIHAKRKRGEKPAKKGDKDYPKTLNVEGKTFDAWKKAAASALGRKKEEKKAEKAQDAGAKARRMLKRREHAKYVSGSTENVPDEMRD